MKISRVLAGLIIAVLGIVLLLNNFGILNWSVWLTLGKLWPVLLILVGILVFFDRALLPLGIILVIVAVIFSFTVPFTFSSNLERTGNFKQSWQLESDIKWAELDLNFGVGTLNIKESVDQMVEFDLSYMGEEPEVKYDVKGDKVTYQVESSNSFSLKGPSQGSSRDWKLFLSPEVIWDIDLDTGAAKADLDFSQIRLKKLEVDSGAADVTISLGDYGIATQLDIDAGASNIKIIVPKNVRLEVEVDGVLSNFNLEAVGLIPAGDYYVTPASVQSDSIINITLDTGVSNFELVRQ